MSGHALGDALDWTLGAYYLDSEDLNSGIVDQPSNVGGRGILFLTNDPAASKDESGSRMPTTAFPAAGRSSSAAAIRTRPRATRSTATSRT